MRRVEGHERVEPRPQRSDCQIEIPWIIDMYNCIYICIYTYIYIYSIYFHHCIYSWRFVNLTFSFSQIQNPFPLHQQTLRIWGDVGIKSFRQQRSIWLCCALQNMSRAGYPSSKLVIRMFTSLPIELCHAMTISFLQGCTRIWLQLNITNLGDLVEVLCFFAET